MAIRGWREKGESRASAGHAGTSSARLRCAFTVTVTDTQPPQITAPADQTRVGTTPGMPLPVDYTFPTSSDNCPGVVANCNPPSGSAFPSGATTVACTATDAAGDTARGARA